MRVCVREGEETEAQKKGHYPHFGSDDIRAIVCAWFRAYDKMSENNVQCKPLTCVSVCVRAQTHTHTLPVSDVMNTVPSLTSKVFGMYSVHTCSQMFDRLRSIAPTKKQTCNLSPTAQR